MVAPSPEFNKAKESDFRVLLESPDICEQSPLCSCDTTPKDYFPNLQSKDKQEKEPILREIFGLQPDEPLLMSECELLEKASQYSGKSIADMALEGRILVAKNEIGRQVQYAQGKGKKGIADDRIHQTYDFMKTSGQKLSINRLTQLSGSNRKTVESWCERNTIVLDNS